jgi:predicted nuclease of predicted toxin-antitoxin system
MTEVRLLADRNIAAPMVRALRAGSTDVACVAEFASGITDDEVLEAAARDARLLLTDDKEFKELAFRPERGQTGVIMLRLPFALASENAVRVVNVLQEHSGRLVGFYTVIEPTRVRFRPLPDSMGLERVFAVGFVRPTAEKRGHHTLHLPSDAPVDLQTAPRDHFSPGLPHTAVP